MKILIMGAGGMIGHKMYEKLKAQHEVYACFRRPFSEYEKFKLFDSRYVIDGIDVAHFNHVEKVLNQVKPDVILNCIGITLRKPEIKDLAYSLEINSLYPHKLKAWVVSHKAHLIHFSTDCVFDGKDEFYTELSPPSADDIYGKTKYLGETKGPHCLTLRGSMIGRELYGKTELLEWAISQKGKTIKGFKKAWYSGVTTQVMADLVSQILNQNPLPMGLLQISSEPITKYDLLVKLNRIMGLNLVINEDYDYVSKKILKSDKVRHELNFVCPSWDEMISHLVSEKTYS